jgi:hypothetical protein
MRKILAFSLLLLLTCTCSAQRTVIPKQDSTAATDLVADFKKYDPQYAEKKELRIRQTRWASLCFGS